ncbi:FeoA family protein [Thalassotalea agariperforans]|mgnify:CR=1 FL=1
MTLTDLQHAQKATISRLPDNFDLTAKLIEQGFALKTEITLAHKAPFNGPLAFRLHGTKMCLPSDIAAQIGVEVTHA